MSSIARFSIRRPVFVSMVGLIVALLGITALLKLPVDLMPDVTFPSMSVIATYDDASPEEVEELITRPIEEGLSAVPGVKEIRSSSFEGRCTVRVSFEWGVNLDEAASDVRDRIDRIISRLPDDVERPRLRKFDAAAFPVCMLGCASDMDPVQLRTFIEDQIQPRLERIDGVGSVDLLGGRIRQIQVRLQPEKIRSLNIAPQTVVQVLKAQNLTLPAGSIEQGNYELLLRTPGYFSHLDEIRDTIVVMRDGAPVRVRDIAEVEDTWARETSAVHIDGQNGIRLMIFKQSDRNTVAVVRNLQKTLEQVNAEFPQTRLMMIFSTADFIENSISNVGMSAVYGGFLAILVLLFFLRSLGSTVAIATSIPLSILATFALLYFTGCTLNMMTLGGLALGVGMLVDNSIVVLENIFRLREEEGMEAAAAAEQGTSEVAAPILASTTTTLVIFLPLFFIEGMAGIMFSQLAMVICYALLSAYIASITLIPMLSARLRKREPGEVRLAWLSGLIGRSLERMTAVYTQLLARVLLLWPLSVLLVLLLLGVSLALVPYIGTEMLPESDESRIDIRIEMAVGTRLGVTLQITEAIEQEILQAVSETKCLYAGIGGQGWRDSGSYLTEMQLYLVKPRQRRRTDQQIADALRLQLVGRYPGCVVRVQKGMSFFTRMMGGGSDSRVQIDIRGHDLETGDALAQQVKEVMEGVRGITDARVSRESGAPEELFRIDRTKTSILGLDVAAVATFLETSIAGTTASYFREDGNEHEILVKLLDSEYRELNEIHDLTINNSAGVPINLRNITRLESRKGPTRIERKNQERVLTVNCNYTDRDIGSIIAEAMPQLNAIARPADFSIHPSGNWEDQQETFRELIFTCLLALVLVYMVMACQYESLKDPLVVMFSVPLAVIGVLLLLFITETTFNMQSIIGCVMLAGIVVNNAIILVDQIRQLRESGSYGIHAAIVESARRRLRPILMTTLTTILGLVPMALGWGEGGETQAPLARAVIGGLTSSTLITLFFIPVVYTLLSGGVSELKALRRERSMARR